MAGHHEFIDPEQHPFNFNWHKLTVCDSIPNQVNNANDEADRNNNQAEG